MVQDFEKAASLPSVWVVNIPNENASVKLSTEDPHDGVQAFAAAVDDARAREL